MLKKVNRWGVHLAAGTVNRLDIVKVLNRIARSDAGRPHLERYQTLPLDWENAEEISGLATELTLAQLRGENQTVSHDEIDRLIREIRIRYDRDIHISAAAAMRVVLGHLFEHTADLPFTSADGRDLKHIETLKSYREKGLGVLYLINHNSHLDEFIFGCLMQDLELGLPVFAAGQNMMAIESLAKVLMIGSYVVLRKGASRHQMAALYNYCSALSRKGAQQGIFLEAWRGGARTRDGSLRYPKRLVAVRGAIDTDRDLVIQPVALSYSVVPEDMMMCAGKSGKTWLNGISAAKTLIDLPFHPKSFWWRSMKHLYSRCYVSFPEPKLLSELNREWQQDRRGTEFDEYVALDAITQIARTKKVMASQLTARALTGARRYQTGDLEKSLKEEMKTIKIYHRQTFGQAPDFEDFITDNGPSDTLKEGIRTLKKRKVLSRWAKDDLKHPAVENQNGLGYYATHGDRRLYSPTADQNIVVVGAGNWGFALADLVAGRLLDDKAYSNASITIFDGRKKLVRHMGKERLGPGRFQDRRLKKNIFVTHDPASAFRKASEVIIAERPEQFEKQMREIISVSEQHLKVIVATRGFIPGTTLLPFHMVQNLMLEYRRTDMDVLTLAGPIEPDDLLDTEAVTGVVAGPSPLHRELADLIFGPGHPGVMSTDPIGVQAADILARIYATCVNLLAVCRPGKKGMVRGLLFARAAEEARALTLAMGASPATFTAGSIPWTATFTSLATEGPLKELGEKLGAAVKKGKSPARVLNKLSEKWRQNNNKIQLISDMEAALDCGRQREVDMPLLKEAWQMMMDAKGAEQSENTKS